MRAPGRFRASATLEAAAVPASAAVALGRRDASAGGGEEHERRVQAALHVHGSPADAS